ncbi:hypothetical protein [Streptomyces sp. NPDC003697]
MNPPDASDEPRTDAHGDNGTPGGGSASGEGVEGAPGADAPRARRRGRTTLMVAAAAVLGVAAGTCTGYLIQADREPTKLPSLSQPVVRQAKGEVEPLSAAQDRRVRTDGDLRKLLIERPRGARESGISLGSDGWADLAEYADQFKEPSGAFVDLADQEFRRAATVMWQVGRAHVVEIRLVQFRQEEFLGAEDRATKNHYWAEQEDDTRSWPVPGPGDDNGTAYVHDEPERKPGFLPVYSAEAHAWRGDVCMEIWVSDIKPIPKAEIMDLAERQVAKL